MNFAAFERAQVAAFAYREARRTGNLDCLRAVCFILRNRVKKGWGGGSWLGVIAADHLVNAYAAPDLEVAEGNATATDRLLQLIVRDVDDIYLGQESYDDRVRQVVCSLDASAQAGLGMASTKKDWKPALYYGFVDRPPRPWFVENIIRRPEEHAQVTTIGTMLLYR